MNSENLQALIDELQNFQKKIDSFKKSETHPEKQRLLKLVDAEIMDALHNLGVLHHLLSD